MEKAYSHLFSLIPDRIDFDFISVKNETKKNFFLDNISEQTILFSIESAEGFTFFPDTGIIPRHKKVEIQIKIHPELAKVLVSNARIILDQKVKKIIKLSSVSKYPYLTLNKDFVDFDIVQIGHTTEEQVIITNMENVPANFTIERTSTQPGKQPCMFYISNLNGNIPPKSNFLLKILFKPQFPGTTSLETFKISTKGGNKVIFSCKGQCKGLKTWVGVKCVNFGTIPLGGKLKKLFRVYNDSDLPTEFQIYHDNSGAFSFDVTEGIIPAKNNLRVNAIFRPYECMIYYQRVFCIIKNHMVFPLDLFGSCHNLLTKSPLIDLKQIEKFRIKELRGTFFQKKAKTKIQLYDEFAKNMEQTQNFNEIGLNNLNNLKSTTNADLLDDLNKNVNNNDNKGRSLKNSNKSINIEKSMDEYKKDQALLNAQLQLHKEMFWEPFSKTRLISFETDLIDFNFISAGECSDGYELKVYNNSNEDIKVKFIFEKPINLSNLIKTINIFNSENTVFFTQPEEQIIKKNSSAMFKVYFKPNRSEYYFYLNMPCQASIVKSNTNNNNIESSNAPPVSNTMIAFNKLKSKQLMGVNKSKLSDFGKEILGGGKTTTHIKLMKSPGSKSNTLKSLTMYSGAGGLHFSKNKNDSVGRSTKFKLQGTNSSFINPNATITPSLRSNENTQDPPFTSYLSLVGHSFPPGTQIFMPMFEFYPKREIFFPPTSINQSLYQTFKIQNKNDTPLFYHIFPDPNEIFRVHSKYGLIPPHSFHIICLEFTPKDTTVYRFPMQIVFNHDSQNKKVVILNGLCTDPVIDVEGIRNEMYFPPSYIGIKTKKSVNIRNLSPIKVLVRIQIDNMNNGVLEVGQESFEMDINSIKKVDFFLTPNVNDEINAHVLVTAERIYSPGNDSKGLHNPRQIKTTTTNNNKTVDNNKSKELVLDEEEEDKGNISEENNNNQKTLSSMKTYDKRIFTKEFNVLGRGSDGDISVEPSKLDFGTVKIGFHKKLFFSIYNPTITNFYVKIVPDYTGNIILPEDKNNNMDHIHERSDIIFDIREGMLNSFCKKEVSIQFEPKTRASLNFKVNIYTTDNNKSIKKQVKEEQNNLQMNNNNEISFDSQKNQELKCTIEISGKGDYPLIKIVDLRNNLISTSRLWKDFNVDIANEELKKKLTDEEVHYSKAKSNKKIDDVTQKLKTVRFDFGKTFITKKNFEIENKDVYLTLKNEGGVLSEFYFKFPDDINIKREIWMDPVEPTSNDKVEYHVLKEHIFTVEPKKSKLAPGESCNIRLRYTIKEKGTHRLRVLFQVVNGKPLIFELYGETLSEKNGILTVPNKVLDFGNVPIGYIGYITSCVELRNISNIKIKYLVDQEQVKKYNERQNNFEIFKIDNNESAIGPGDSKYLICHFRPLTTISYELEMTVYYSDEVSTYEKKILVRGKGYHPLKASPSLLMSENISTSNEDIPNSIVCNNFNNEMIQKCGFSLENLDFGRINQSKCKTIILYNYSNENSFNFDFVEAGFLIKDTLTIQPSKGEIKPNCHQIIKCILTPDENTNSEYEGDVQVRIMWNNSKKNETSNNQNILQNIQNSWFNNPNSKKSLDKSKIMSPLDGLNNNNNINNLALLSSSASLGANNPVNLANSISPISTLTRVEKENLFLRLSKKCELAKGKKKLNFNINSNTNSCCIEILMDKIIREILCSKEFQESFTKNIDMQPLSLYRWTTNEICPDQEETRKRFVKSLGTSVFGENYVEGLGMKDIGLNRKTTLRMRTVHLGMGLVNRSLNTGIQNKGNGVGEEWTEEDEDKIMDKYMEELKYKLKYSVKELNERIILANDESRKVISDIIMESTIYNIICEAVYGEIDLTEKQRIYFFIDKNNPPPGLVNSNNNSINDEKSKEDIKEN